jgi:hypothetical protein
VHWASLTLCRRQELKDQQVNELGKTFMPYTQSNYRMHPMVSPLN